MDGLIEFLPIIAIVIFGIIRSITGGNQQGNQQERPKRQPIPRPTATPSGGQLEPKPTVYQSPDEREPSETVYTSSTEDVYTEEEQIADLKSRLNIGTDDLSNDEMDISLGNTIQDVIKNQSSLKINENQEQFKKDVKTGLNPKGLVQGVIMAEVLGPPRARKPYRSVIVERRRNSR